MPVIIRNLQPPGAFEIENTGEEIDLAWPVGVQQQTAAGWEDRVVQDLRLIESCEPPPGTPCRRLSKGGKIRPIPWPGFSHTGQCEKSARANLYLGPGTFRFVVASCDGAHKFYGEPFVLGDAPKAP
jgi:hypothetical protein